MVFIKITAKHSGKALGVVARGTNDGANVQQWSYNGGWNQNWEFTRVDGGGNDDHNTPVSTNGFHTSGTTLYDAKGKPSIFSAGERLSS